MKNVQERMKENNSEYKIQVFRQKQALPYEAKVAHARIRAREFYEDMDGMCYISVGGLDSITLLLFLRSIGIKDIPAVSVSTLEDKSVQRVHKALGVEALKPLKSKTEVIREFGFPVLSKELARKIHLLQNPTEKNKIMRHAIITGETGEYGGFKKNSRMKMSQKWLKKFGGYENEREGVNYGIPNFMVSDKCCYYLKEKPCNDYQRITGRYPYIGLMASEGGRRQKALMINGCNYISERTKRSCPFAIFSRQDILMLALEMEDWYQEHWQEFSSIHLDSIVPEIYGTIAEDPDGGGCTLRAHSVQDARCVDLEYIWRSVHTGLIF